MALCKHSYMFVVHKLVIFISCVVFHHGIFGASIHLSAFSFFIVFSLKNSAAGNIFVFPRVIFLGYIPLMGHFSACQMAALMLTVFCVRLHLPCLGGNKFPGYQLLRGVGGGGAVAGRRRIFLIRCTENAGCCVNTLILYDVASIGVFYALRTSMVLSLTGNLFSSLTFQFPPRTF